MVQMVRILSNSANFQSDFPILSDKLILLYCSVCSIAIDDYISLYELNNGE